MTALRLWWRLRRTDRNLVVLVLPLIAFAVATGALLIVLGGLSGFAGRTGPDQEVYLILAQTAAVLLVVPVLTLGGAAARLSVARRNERLAMLRLAGATTMTVRIMTLADAASQALAGAVGGVVLCLAALPAVALIPFQGRPFTWAELLLPAPYALAAVGGVVLLATGSALTSMLGVSITPLGVAQRVSPRRLSILRVLVTVVVLIAWALVMQQPNVTMILVVLGVCLAVANLIGPFVLWVCGHVARRLARSAPQLIAARRLLDDPRAAWRSVGGIAMITYIAGLLAIAPAMARDLGQLAIDIQTGSMVTLVIAAILAAVSAGVTQTARLFDQQAQYRNLHLAGTDPSVLRATRLREIWLPYSAAVIISMVAALAVVAPIGLSLAFDGAQGMITFGIVVAGSLALVMTAVAVTNPLVNRVALGTWSSARAVSPAR